MNKRYLLHYALSNYKTLYDVHTLATKAWNIVEPKSSNWKGDGKFSNEESEALGIIMDSTNIACMYDARILIQEVIGIQDDKFNDSLESLIKEFFDKHKDRISYVSQNDWDITQEFLDFITPLLKEYSELLNKNINSLRSLIQFP